jgi:hypothetical protein
MMKKSAMLMILILLATAFPSGPVAAKSYIDVVTIVGPDWFGEIELTGSEIPESLVMGGFFNPQQPISPPAGLGRGYLITRGYDNDGHRQMFDRMMYFPGSPGYVYYLEIIDGSGPYDGHWFSVTEDEGEALLSALRTKGARLTTDVVQRVPDPVPERVDLIPLIGLALTALVGGAAGWILRAVRDRSRLARTT